MDDADREYLLSLVRRDAATPRQHTYQAVRELLLRSPATASHLSAFELKVFSQNGEDGIVAEITRRLGIEMGYFVEFGIETGVEGNCVFLANILGWRGLFMEGDAAMFAELSRKYRFNPKVATANALVSPENIDEVLRLIFLPPIFCRRAFRITTSEAEVIPKICSVDDIWISPTESNRAACWLRNRAAVEQ